jgi:mono/diheme cytochrome c family protein
MKNKLRYLFLALAVVAALNLVRSLAAASGKHATKQDAARIERGKYLVTLSGCADCHTPKKLGPHGPEDDLTRWLSGHPEEPQLPPPPALGDGPWFASTAGLTAWAGPWGVSYAANLTPDVNSGLGIWTEDMFLKTMRTGKHMGSGRDILPPMPWQNLKAVHDDDLKAIFAYLRSLPPISNHVPSPLGPDGKVAFE